MEKRKIELTVAGFDPYKNCGDCVFDYDQGYHYQSFIEECLTHIEGRISGKPFILEEWQVRFILNIFGWIRPDGTRRFRKVLLYIPRKNGKSTLCAAIINCLLYIDQENGAQIYCAAGTRDQANLVFRHAAGMIRAKSFLESRVRVYKTSRTIVKHEDNASFIKVIPSDAETQHGLNSHAVVIDELHVQKDRHLVDALVTSTGARDQPLVVYATTADFDRPSICNEVLDYAVKVRDNVINDPYFMPVVYECTKTMDWRSEETWKAVNPNYGVTIRKDYFESECQRALDDPSYENTFKRLHLNMKTEQAERWIPMHLWKECGETYSEEDLRYLEGFAGVDMASSEDIAAFVIYFHKIHALKCYFWIPADNINKYDMYKTWVDQGHITATPGNIIEHGKIIQTIVESCQQYNVKDVGFDPYDMTNPAIILQEEFGIEMIKYPQTFGHLNEPCKNLMGLIVSGALRHNNNPVLTWMASNVAKKTNDTGQMRPTKKLSKGKIDGISASLIAIGRYLNSTPTVPSIYEKRGALVF